MSPIHSLPPVEKLGFRWRAYSKARKVVERVAERRREVQRREAELKTRIEAAKQEDIKRLSDSLLSGASDEAAPPELEDLASQLKELHRLREALKTAEPQAESELIRTVQEHRDRWIPEVDNALARALEEERDAFSKALELADSAREKRLRLEQLSAWVRSPLPSFSPPSDVSVRSAFDRLRGDIDHAEHRLDERAANERLLAAQAARTHAEIVEDDAV